MGRDGAEVFLDSVRAVEAWADERPSGERELPRGLPPITTRFRGREIQKVPMGYSLYSLQQLQAVLRALSEAERKQVDAALAGTGFEAVLDHQPRHPVEKDGFKLVLSG